MAEPQKEFNLDNLPTVIGDWLGSAPLTYLIMDMNQRLGFDGIKIGIIPDLIMDLVERIISPEEFIPNLSKEMDVDLATATSMAHEIEEKMLRPIELPLRKEGGVDIKRIFWTQEPSTKQPSSKPTEITAMPKLIATQEAAHPQEQRPASAPLKSPVYSPAPQPKPAAPAPAPAPMPKIEPLPTPPRQAPTPPSIPVKIKVEPSRVPGFLQEENNSRPKS